MKSRTFPVYSDPGHAWVKVPKAFLRTIIGHDWRKVFTPFSYERGDFTYLEEDEDALRFTNWCKASGYEPVFKEGSCAQNRSRIRSYSPLQPIGD